MNAFQSPKSTKLKICYWNIHGTKSQIIPDKLCDQEFLEQLKNSDIVALSELHTEKASVSLPGYVLKKQKNREKKHKGPKISGGLALFVKENLSDLVHVIPNTSDDSIWLNLKQRSSESSSLYFGAFYISPENTQGRGKGKGKGGKNSYFFDLMNQEITKFQNKGTVLIKGDLNARIGREVDVITSDKFDDTSTTLGIDNSSSLPSRNSEDEKTNPRGTELLDFCKANEYAIVNGRKVGDAFGKYTSHQWNGSSVVDYLITPASDFAKIESFSVGEFTPWLSDHCPIFTEIDLEVSRDRPGNPVNVREKEPHYIWNEDGRDKFMEKLKEGTIRRELESLMNASELDSTKLANGLKDVLVRTARDCKLKKSKGKKTDVSAPWFDKDCSTCKNSIRNLGKRLKQTPCDEEIRTNLFAEKRRFKKLVRLKKRLHKMSILHEMKSCNNRQEKHFWNLAKRLNKNETNNAQFVSHKSLFDHFKQILNAERNVELPSDSREKGKLDQHFTLDELKKACRVLKNGKATGIDNLSNEMIHCFTEIYPEYTINLFNEVLDSNVIVEDWTIGMITPIHKKGSKSDPNNYRGISLLSCLGKLFTTLLYNRLLEFALTNKILSPNQLGFLPGNRTSDALLMIHNIIQKRCHINSQWMYSTFIDFSKAFDTIPRDTLLNKLLKYDIKGNFFNVIKNIYTKDKVCVKMNNQVTDSFDVNLGVKQGCILSPLLFNLFLADLPALLDDNLRSSNPTATHPSCLIWADDIVLLSETEKGLQTMLKTMEQYCNDNELTLNTDKTKCMILNKTGRTIRKNFTFNSEHLETVRSFKYLGFVITPSGEIKTGLSDLRDRAMKAFFSLKRCMGELFNTHIDITLHLFDTLIKPILLYASDFWGGLKPPQDNPVEKFHNMACRHILGVQTQTTTAGVLLELGRIPIQTFAIKGAVKNWERIRLGNANIYLQKCLEDATRENLPWIENIKNILENNGMACFFQNTYEVKHPFVYKKLFEKLSDIFHQETFSTIADPKSKLRTYALLKKDRGLEQYLCQIPNFAIRRTLSKFRLSNHVLNIETGRHRGESEDQRFCPFCPGAIETEIHFLVQCEAYQTQRQQLLSIVTPAYFFYTPLEKFQYLLSEEVVTHTAKFVYSSFEARKTRLENGEN